MNVIFAIPLRPGWSAHWENFSARDSLSSHPISSIEAPKRRSHHTYVNVGCPRLSARKIIRISRGSTLPCLDRTGRPSTFPSTFHARKGMSATLSTPNQKLRPNPQNKAPSSLAGKGTNKRKRFGSPCRSAFLRRPAPESLPMRSIAGHAGLGFIPVFSYRFRVLAFATCHEGFFWRARRDETVRPAADQVRPASPLQGLTD